jgi:hypothetical protein
MKVIDRVKEALSEHHASCPDTEELTRLQEFFQRMKDAGVAKTQEYDLPQPDTLGRAQVESFRSS